MKTYRCVFAYGRGRTAIDVIADDAERALRDAILTVPDAADDVEVWDETGLVLHRQHSHAATIENPSQS